MKFIGIILISLSFFVASCKKPVVETEITENIDNVNIFRPGKMKFGQASATLNNKIWTASSEAYLGAATKFVEVIAATYSDDSTNFITETFTFMIPSSLKRYNEFTLKTSLERLDNECLVRYGLKEHDGPLVNFVLDTAKLSNYVELTFLDSTRVTGKFDLIFKSLPRSGKKDLIYRFKDGMFDAKVIK
jgi:hypothetical protein